MKCIEKNITCSFTLYSLSHLPFLCGMQLSNFPGQPITTIRIEDVLGTLKTGDLIFTKEEDEDENEEDDYKGDNKI